MEKKILGADARIAQLLKKIEELKAGQVTGFSYDGVPQFKQGAPDHEMLELVTSEDCAGYVSRIAKLTDKLRIAVVAIEKASEEIRKCDYTPARSRLLVALATIGEEDAST